MYSYIIITYIVACVFQPLKQIRINKYI